MRPEAGRAQQASGHKWVSRLRSAEKPAAGQVWPGPPLCARLQKYGRAGAQTQCPAGVTPSSDAIECLARDGQPCEPVP